MPSDINPVDDQDTRIKTIKVALMYAFNLWDNNVSGLNLWGQETHICVSKLIITATVTGLSPGHHQAMNQRRNTVNWIIGNKLQWNLNKNFSISLEKTHLKMSTGNWRPFCFELMCWQAVLTTTIYIIAGWVWLWTFCSMMPLFERNAAVTGGSWISRGVADDSGLHYAHVMGGPCSMWLSAKF